MKERIRTYWVMAINTGQSAQTNKTEHNKKNLELSPSSNFCVIFFYLINGPEIAYVLDEIRQHKFDDNTTQNPDFISIHCILFHAETNPQN